MVYRVQPLRCVECGAPLEEMVVRGFFECLGCDACGGLWIGAGQLLALLRRLHPEKQVDALEVHNYESRQRHCPVCNNVMDMAWIELLQLDCCSDHGVWLDRGELQRIARWDVLPDLPDPKPRRR